MNDETPGAIRGTNQKPRRVQCSGDPKQQTKKERKKERKEGRKEGRKKGRKEENSDKAKQSKQYLVQCNAMQCNVRGIGVCLELTDSWQERRSEGE